jgi:hypothetical protein
VKAEDFESERVAQSAADCGTDGCIRRVLSITVMAAA